MAESEKSHRGTLYIRVGPMFSGKTTWLNWELTKLADKGFRVVKLIHLSDERDDVASSSEKGTTHNSTFTDLSPKIKCFRVEKLSHYDPTGFHVIGIDESQFFDDLVENVKEWVEKKGIHVRVSGLCGDINKNKFGSVLDLIPFCDGVEKMTASCVLCLKDLKKADFKGNILAIDAPFTRKIGASLPIPSISTPVIDIGGSDKYIPVCRYHHSSPWIDMDDK